MSERSAEEIVVEVLFLRCVYGLPIRAIAKRLGLPRHTVRRLLGECERRWPTACERTAEPSGPTRIELEELGDLARLLGAPIRDD